jgi:hypothetical protein
MPARSPAQIAASRANGARSNGPVTPAGKAVSRGNSVKHGMCSAVIPLPGEDPDAVARELADWQAQYRPASAAARILTEECARAAVNLRRIARWHDAMIHYQIDSFLKAKKEGDDRALQAAWDLLDETPILALEHLLETSDGCRWMADAWDVIAGLLEQHRPLDPFLRDLGVRLLGGLLHGPLVWEFDLLCELHAAKDRRSCFASYMARPQTPPSLRKKYTELPFRDAWMSRLKAIVEEKRSRLRQREAGPRDVHEPAALARILPTYLCLADDRDSTKYHRYHRDALSTLHRGIKSLAAFEPGPEVEWQSPPPEPPPPPTEVVEDMDVHAGFDESDDVGPVDVPGHEDPLSRNEPEPHATPYIQRGYAGPPGGYVPPASGHHLNAGSAPGSSRPPGPRG